MINVGDVGNDYEHCLQLMKKLNEFRGATSGVRGVFHVRSLCGCKQHLQFQASNISR